VNHGTENFTTEVSLLTPYVRWIDLNKWENKSRNTKMAVSLNVKARNVERDRVSSFGTNFESAEDAIDRTNATTNNQT